MKKTLRFSACLLLVSSFAFAQNPKSWTKVNEQEIKIVKDAKGREFPYSSKYFRLDIASMRQTLFSAPKLSQESNVIISIPTVDGEMEHYRIWENSNFAPELQAQFPDIRAYSGIGVNDKTASIRISVAPNGIQTMVLKADKKSEFIEPYSADGKVYALFNSDGRQFEETPFVCSTQDDHELHNRLQQSGGNSTFSNNQSFKTFRLALSCTAEYTTYHGGVAGALAAMNATMSRVNGVFAIDLAVKLELIENNSVLIYTDAATDPYSDATVGSGGAWNLELQNNLTATIGNGAYDIGHLFGASGGGGNAGCIGCVCVNPTSSSDEAKGSGFTSPSNNIPAGDLFDIDYVAHEIGHQLGANHTFSHSNEINGVNVEPGSGSTIMGYAGITSYNVQSNSDDYFTYRSILQIQNNLATKTCPVSVPMTNTPPTVNAGADYTIPRSTPFKLVGTGNDAQTNSSLKYTWEQNDPAQSTAVTGASSVASPTKTTGPNFRSLPPTSLPERYMPALGTVLSNQLSSTYESVSSVARQLNFTLTARDYGTTGGQTNTDAMVVTVNAAVGPFDVTSQNVQDASWTQGATEVITWAVNNANTLPGSANVNIYLSTDGGLTYPITLASNVPNNGSATITVPNVPAAQKCRVMVKPTGNIYYDINPRDFAIGYVVTTTTNCVPFSASPNTTITYNTANPAQWFVVGQVNVPNNFEISDLNLAINLSHSKINDLRIGLVKPGSSSIDRILYDKSCPGFGIVPTSIITTYDDSGATFGCAGVANSNTYKPVNSLDVFNGLNSAGLWRVAINDTTPADNGTFNSFTLTLCSSNTTYVLSNEDFSLANFAIYPNPNNGNFTVQFDSKSSNEIKIGVHDLRGRQIFNKSYQNSGIFNQNLELNNVQSGVYLVTVQDGDRKEVKKIVIQ